MNPLYISIDGSNKSNVVYFMKPDGSKHSNFSANNSLDCTRQLSKRIFSVITSESLTGLVTGLEASSVYGENPVCFLMENGSLAKINRKIHVLNPKQFKKFKASYSDLPKTVNNSVNQVLSISISSMKSLETQIKGFDEAVTTQLELIPNTLHSIKGIGPVYSSGIIAEIRNINHFLNKAI